jgi:hypothetical protein
MSAEMKVYSLGQTTEIEDEKKYDDYSLHNYGDFVFQKYTSKNMNTLWERFYKNQSYPEYYLGVAKRMAICKCPDTGKEEWFNGERCLSLENLVKGSTVEVKIKIKDKTYTRDLIFMGWEKTPVHEWVMTNGTTLQLNQKFIDGLFPEDRRYLKIRNA